MSCGQPAKLSPQRLPVATATGRQQVVLSQRLSGGADGVQGVALGPATPRRPLGPADLDHPLTAGLQEGGQPGAVAAGALHRPEAPTGHLRLGKFEQLTVAGPISRHGRLTEPLGVGRDAPFRSGAGRVMIRRSRSAGA